MAEVDLGKPMQASPPETSGFVKERTDSTQALLTLAQELWIVKDRQLVLEALIKARGVEVDIDGYQPEPALAERIATERKRFVSSLVDVLLEA